MRYNFLCETDRLGVGKGFKKLLKFDKYEPRLLFHCCILFPRKCLHKTPFQNTVPPPSPLFTRKPFSQNEKNFSYPMLSSFAYSLQIITQKNQWITHKKYTITLPPPLKPPNQFFFFEYQLLIRNCFKWWSWLWCLRTYDKKIKTKKKTKQNK